MRPAEFKPRKREEGRLSHRVQKSNIKIYNEQPLPQIEEGMTLDKYLGCTFTVVDQNDIKFDKEFGEVPSDESI